MGPHAIAIVVVAAGACGKRALTQHCVLLRDAEVLPSREGDGGHSRPPRSSLQYWCAITIALAAWHAIAAVASCHSLAPAFCHAIVIADHVTRTMVVVWCDTWPYLRQLGAFGHPRWLLVVVFVRLSEVGASVIFDATLEVVALGVLQWAGG
jgi:hypothetical protein